MDIQVITREIAPKGKAYLVVKGGDARHLAEAVTDRVAELKRIGARQVYAASTHPALPLAEGRLGGCRLRFAYDMLGMERALGPDRPKGAGSLRLEPLTGARGEEWLAIYDRSFFDVPCSGTYGREALEHFLGPDYRCGFAALDGQTVGIYECGFKKEHPEIGSIALTGAVRGRGLGRELLLTVMDFLADLGERACWLQVSTANTPAYALYQSVGFQLDRLLARWYEVEWEG